MSLLVVRHSRECIGQSRRARPRGRLAQDERSHSLSDASVREALPGELGQTSSLGLEGSGREGARTERSPRQRGREPERHPRVPLLVACGPERGADEGARSSKSAELVREPNESRDRRVLELRVSGPSRRERRASGG